MKTLHKNLDLSVSQIKFAQDGDVRTFSGYASVFGGVDSYGDTIMQGAYSATLEKRERPIAMRWNHYGDVIGKWTSIKEDENGLYVEGELTPNHSLANDVYASLKHGAVSGLSIGYRPKKFEENETGGYDLSEIDLFEISIVETPADLSAQVSSVKSAVEEAKSLKEIEAILREQGGFSRGDAVALVSRIKSVAHSDYEQEKNTAEIAGLFQKFKNPAIK